MSEPRLEVAEVLGPVNLAFADAGRAQEPAGEAALPDLELRGDDLVDTEHLGDGAGDLRGAAGGIEREGIGPDEAEGFADLGQGELGEEDAVRGRVRERGVGAAGAGELGVEIDAVADIDDDEEGRAAFAGREMPARLSTS